MPESKLPITSLPTRSSLPATEVISVFEEDSSERFLEVDLRQYWRICLKYRFLIFGIIATCTTLALIYAFTATPQYSAKAVIRIGSYQPMFANMKIEDLLQQKNKDTDYFETQVQQLRSLSLADLVLQNAPVRQTIAAKKEAFWRSWFQFGASEEELALDRVSGYKNPIKLIKKYLGLVEIVPVRRTSLVNIQVGHKDPAFAATAANLHATAYIDWVRNTRIEQESRGLTFLNQQADELRARVAELEQQQTAYAEANSIVAVNKDENITAQKMSQLNALLSTATAKHITQQNAYEQAKKTLYSNSAGFDDPSLEHTRSELARLEGEYAQFAAKFNPSYPKMVQLSSQIEQLKKTITSQREQILRGLEAKAAAAEKEVVNLKEELEQQKSQAFELSRRQVQYNAIDRELQSSRELLQNVLKQIKETSLSVENNSSSVAVIDKAVTPVIPTHPKKLLIIFIGILLGVVGGLGVAFLLNYIDNTVRTPDDIASMVKLPSLGVIPSFQSSSNSPRKLQALPSSISTPTSDSAEPIQPAVKNENRTLTPMFLIDGRSLVSEAYRTVRTNILLSKAGERPKKILISSAHPSEGKTTISVNLAVALASTGAKVCLLDLDLRRPSVHKQLGWSSQNAGIVEVLTGNATIEEVTRTMEQKGGISVITCGSIPPNPTELVGSIEMANITEQLAKEYDHVVIDSAPLLPVTDSVLLSVIADGVVLVVKGATTPARAVNDAKAKLRNAGARLMGVVLNDVDMQGSDYYYYKQYYHSYYYGVPTKPREATEDAA